MPDPWAFLPACARTSEKTRRIHLQAGAEDSTWLAGDYDDAIEPRKLPVTLTDHKTKARVRRGKANHLVIYQPGRQPS